MGMIQSSPNLLTSLASLVRTQVEAHAAEWTSDLNTIRLKKTGG